MHRSAVAVVVAVIGVCGSSSASAQGRKVGVVMGYPASVGVLWHVSDAVAVRPDVTLNWTSTETTTAVNVIGGSQTSTTSVDGWTTAIGLGALFYLGPAQELRFYVVPRAAYVWSNTETDASPELPQLVAFDTESDGFLVSGAFGAQYAVHERFRVFGELGLTYSTQESESGFSISRSTFETTSFGLRSGVGVVIYF